MQTKIIERYFFFILLFSVFLFSFLIFRPFWIVLTLGISFSIVFFPIYQWFNKKLPDWLSAALTVALFIIIICGLLFGVSMILLNQSQNVYEMVTNNANPMPFIDSINTSINNFLPHGVSFDLYEKITALISLITNNVTSIFTSTLSTIFSFFLTFLSMFFFLKDNKYWKKSIKIISPLSDENDEKIINKIALSISGIFRGYVAIVLIQGTLVSIGLTIFKVPNPALWGLLAMITALVPTIGSGLVTIPAVIYLYTTGDTLNAIGLAVWGLALVAAIDNILNPIIVGKKVSLPPLLILFAVLGGISLFGPVGIIVGPLTISLLYTLISIYRNEFQNVRTS